MADDGQCCGDKTDCRGSGPETGRAIPPKPRQFVELPVGGGAAGNSAVADVREALSNLGYADAEIREALRELPPGDDASALLRDALKLLGARRAG